MALSKADVKKLWLMARIVSVSNYIKELYP